MAYYDAGNNINPKNINDTTDENTIVDDLSIIPFEKDSFAICELCGRVGQRNHFYYRNNKFCSMRCSYSSTRRRTCTWRFKLMEGTEHMAGLIPLEPLPQLQHWQATFNELQAGPVKKSASLIANSYEWKDELFGCDFLAAPVNLFKHAPLHEICTFEGMKVEVKNTESENDSEKSNDYFWVATVLKVKGYMGLLRYEGCGSDDSKDFWVNLCCSEVHPVGWCATRGKPIIPPRSIADKYTDWKKFLVRQLTGARTLPANFYTKLHDSLVSRFSVGCIMEVVDKNRISQVKVATVSEIVGKRLHVKYYDSSPEDNGFWCHEDSPLIHPVGWAFRIGHPLDAPQHYCQRVAAGRHIPNDTVPELFNQYPTSEVPLFSEGEKIEAIDPLNLSAVCAATVMQILNEGYMMIRIDCYPAEVTGADWFCYHERSPCIFPVGFAQANNIPLIPPNGYTAEHFSWEDHLQETGAVAAPRAVFGARGHVVSHGFVAGMRLECADLMDPRLVCVATVARVVADLLKVHFDGWGAEYDQWLWAHSTDVYPVGWCRAVGHRLEGPLQPAPPAKRTAAKPLRRRRRPTKAHPLNMNEDSSQNSDIGEMKNASTFSSMTDVFTDPEASVSMETFKMDSTNIESTKMESTKLESTKIESPIMESSNMESTKMESTKMESTNIESTKLEPTKMEVDVKTRLIEPEDALGDSSSKATLSTHTVNKTKEEYMENAPATSSNIPSNEDDSMDSKIIPRLVNTSVPLEVLNSLEPETWTTADVAKFLTINDCQTYCVNFSHINGAMLIQLSKDEIIEMLEMKVGPSLKIYDLIQQLVCKIRPQSRMVTFK